MLEWTTNLSFVRIGWAVLQFLWISTFLIGATALILKLLERYSSRLKYRIILGAFLLLVFIPILLWMEHSGTLTPIGLADWGGVAESASTSSPEPVFSNLPKLSPVDLGQHSRSIYYGLGLFWAVGTFGLLTYYLASVMILRLRCQQLSQLRNTEIENRIEKWTEKLRISTRFRLRKVRPGQGPAVAGIVRPYLLLPDRLTFHYTGEELDELLMHELFHIKRRDYLVSFIQRIICSLFFMQPLIWWLSRQMDREREHACDELVTGITQNTYRYASTLLKVHSQTQPEVGGVLHITKNSTVDRIRKMTESDLELTHASRNFSRSVIAFLVMFLTTFGTIWSSYHLHYGTPDQAKIYEKDTEVRYIRE